MLPYSSRRRRRRATGNRALYDLPLSYAATLDEVLDSVLIPTVGLSAIKVAWGAGDANAPRIWLGAMNTTDRLTLTGVPTAVDTPWVDSTGARIQAERHTGTSYRSTATQVDPAVGQDAVVILVGKYPPVGATNERFFSTRSLAQGVVLYCLVAGRLGSYIQTSGGAGGSAIATVQRGLFAVVLVYDRTAGQAYLWTPGETAAAAAIPPGTIAGSGLAIASDPNGVNPLQVGGQILSVVFATGAGIAAPFIADTYALPKRITRLVTGIDPRTGAAPTFTRATAAAWKSTDDRYHIASSGMARAGDGDGLRLEAARTNKVYNTINPTATTGWTATGGTHSHSVDDSAALATAKMENFGPYVHRFVPGAGDEQIYGGAATGGVSAHSASVFMRGAAGGETVDVCLRAASDGSLQVAGTATLTTAWVRYEYPGVTPAAADQAFALDADAGDTIYFTLPQLEAGATVSSPIPNWATAAGATRNAETCDLGVSPAAASGAIAATIEALDYVGSTGDGRIITRGTTDADLVTIAAGMYTASDGTSTVTGSVGPSTGSSQAVRTWWGANLGISTDGTPDTDAYDGAIGGAGVYRLTHSGAGMTGIGAVKIYRRGGP